MARLSARERAALPDSAFAYIDSSGERRLPINDEPRVRNALARFDQVAFEDEPARERARQRLLAAAKRHGIVPIGFITGQLRAANARSAAGRIIIELARVESTPDLEAELRRALDDPALHLVRWSSRAGAYIDTNDEPVAPPVDDADRSVTFVQAQGRPRMAVVHRPGALDDSELAEAVVAAIHVVNGKELLAAGGADTTEDDRPELPDGLVSFLLTDIEGSTPLLAELGASVYATVLGRVRDVIRAAVLAAGGREVEARADEYVAVFEDPSAAVDASIHIQNDLSAASWPSDKRVSVRIGIHTGEIRLTDSGYVGMAVHAAARIMAEAAGGQVLVSAETAERLDSDTRHTADLRSTGERQLRGLAGWWELLAVAGRQSPGS